MANINDAQRVRLAQGSTVTFTKSASSYDLISRCVGSLSWKNGLEERKLDYELDAPTAIVRPGMRRPSEINLDAWLTAEGYDSSELVDLLESSFTGGALVLFDTAIKIFDSAGGPGKILTWTNCWCPEGIDFKEASEAGADADRLSCKILSTARKATPTDFT